MPKYTVCFMTPYCTWEGIEAKNEEDAITKVSVPAEYDPNEPGSFIAMEEEED